MAALNTYYSFKARRDEMNIITSDSAKELYEPNNYIFFKTLSASKQKANNHASAFRMALKDDPNCVVKSKDCKYISQITDPKTLQKHDIAEILRSDYSRLFYDIDCHTLLDPHEEVEQAFKMVGQMLQIISNTPNYSQYIYAVVETNKQDDATWAMIRNIISQAQLYDEGEKKNTILYYNPYTTKELSSHIYINTFYFSREDLYDLFQPLNSLVKREDSTLPNCIDTCVYVKNQRVFRYPLSGKLEQNRKPSPYVSSEDYAFARDNFFKFVATKTEEDTTLIASVSKEFTTLKTLINSCIRVYKIPKQITKAAIDTKICLMVNEEGEKIMRRTKIGKQESEAVPKTTDRPYSTHAMWYHQLIKKIAIDILINKNISDEALLEKFSKEEYQYFSVSNNKKLYQPSSVKSAILSARKNKLSYRDMIYNFDTVDEQIIPQSFQAFRDKVMNHSLTVIEICIEIYRTFVFFRGSSEMKNSANYIVYKNEDDEYLLTPLPEFKKFLHDRPILFQLKLPNVDDDGKIMDVLKPTELTFVIDKFQQFQRYYNSFDFFSLNPKNFHFYKQPITPSEIVDITDERLEGVNEVINTWATEDDEVSQEKKDYILDYFAYILQHPETRNFHALIVSSLPGIGKNTITNMICKYIGLNNTLSNADIDAHILNTFNSTIDMKKFIVVNELNCEDRNTDALKSLITEDEIIINKKNAAQRKEQNIANYIFFTNHADVSIITSVHDRRFTFIRSNGKPISKEVCDKIYAGPGDFNFKEDVYQAFINHLLSRDLTNYNPSKPMNFDKQHLQEIRDTKKHPLYRLIKLLSKTVFKDQHFIPCRVIQQYAYANINDPEDECVVEISKYGEFEEFEDILCTLGADFKTIRIYKKTIVEILSKHNECGFEWKIWKKGEYRDLCGIAY